MNRIPQNWQNGLIAFILFRFFDIRKPLGIRELESLNGGLGVMADDLLAGIFANLLLHAFVIIKV
jgi:phosphatidylglycerophosphatase A